MQVIFGLWAFAVAIDHVHRTIRMRTLVFTRGVRSMPFATGKKNLAPPTHEQFFMIVLLLDSCQHGSRNRCPRNLHAVAHIAAAAAQQLGDRHLPFLFHVALSRRGAALRGDFHFPLDITQASLALDVSGWLRFPATSNFDNSGSVCAPSYSPR